MNGDGLGKAPNPDPLTREQLDESKIRESDQRLDGRSELVSHFAKDDRSQGGIPGNDLDLASVTDPFACKNVDRIFFVGDEHRVALARREQIRGVLGQPADQNVDCASLLDKWSVARVGFPVP